MNEDKKKKKAEYMNKYYHANKDYREKCSKQSEEARIKLRQEILLHYSKGDIPQCECCGCAINRFLTIDHKNGGGSKQRKTGVTGSSFCKWIKKNNFPDEFRILCMNCNFAIGIHEECPHKRKSPPDSVGDFNI